MLRLATPDRLRFGQAGSFTATFGGGEANVAVSLANYGLPVEFVTRVPKNDIADSCLRELRKYGVGTSHVVYGGDRLGIYFLETGAVARPSKVVYDRAHSSVSEIAPGMVDWEKRCRTHRGSIGRALRRQLARGLPTPASKRSAQPTGLAILVSTLT